MSKSITFRLNSTLKCGSNLYLKGTVFDKANIPQELLQEVESGSKAIEIISFGDDFEGSEFDSDNSITLKNLERKPALKSIDRSPSLKKRRMKV